MTEAIKIMEEHLARVKELRRMEAEMKAYTLLANLHNYSKENERHKIDWSDREQPKYCINFNYQEDKLEILEITDLRDLGQVYFYSRKACKKAIDLFKEDLLDYFHTVDEEFYDGEETI